MNVVQVARECRWAMEHRCVSSLPKLASMVTTAASRSWRAGLRDAGFHVIYAGLWQSPEAVARAVADEDADWLGLSLLSGAHMTLVPRVLDVLREAGAGDVGLLVGGIVPDEDVPRLIQLGVARVFGPGTPLEEIAEFLRRRGRGPRATPHPLPSR